MIDRSLASQTRATYERHAAGFDKSRSRGLLEAPWLDRLLAMAPTGEAILDVGCGAAEPIAQFFVGAGRAVHGVDFAEAMLDISRQRFPGQRWTHADMRTLDLGTTFGGVVAWDSFFHLTADEQRLCLPRLAEHVAPGGGLLFTCGPKAGEVVGTVEGEPVYHASLSPEEYAAVLEREGLGIEAFVPEDPTCGFRTICLAARA